MATFFSADTKWIAALLLVFIQGCEATVCYYRDIIGFHKSTICSYGCCGDTNTNSYGVCCSSGFTIGTSAIWGIGVSILGVIGLVVALTIWCCCRTKQRAANAIVNGTTTNVVYGNSAMQPGAYPVPQPGYYPAQPGYNPSAPGYNPAAPHSANAPAYAEGPPSYETVTGGETNKSFDATAPYPY